MEVLHKGHSKFRNIMVGEPANIKTITLNPIISVFHTFCNPTCHSFSWLGAENAECIFLNDFPWSQWRDFPLMYDRQMLHLLALKTHYTKDIVFDRDKPIFCTRKQPIIYIKNGMIDERETEMMVVC